MALVFGAATTDVVDHGSAASLDDLPLSTFTVWAWVYRTANRSNQHIFSKDNSFPSGWSLTANNVSGTDGELRFVVFRTDSTGTNWADAISASGLIALNVWTFVAGTYDPTGTPQMRLYIGTATTPVAEVGSYFRQQNGVGSFLSDAAANLYVGNLQRSTTLPFLGNIERGGLVAGSLLTAGQLAQLQYGGLAQANVAGTRLLFGYAGTGTQADYSGTGNNGTVTGATAGAGAPLGNWFGHDDAASLTNVLAKALAATIAHTASVTRAFAGTRTAAASIAHAATTTRAFAGTRALAASVANAVALTGVRSGGTAYSRAIAATVAHAATLARAGTFARTLAASIAHGASVARQASSDVTKALKSALYTGLGIRF